MATARAMLERRRSSRVLIRIPVQVHSNETGSEPRDNWQRKSTVRKQSRAIRNWLARRKLTPELPRSMW